MKERLEAYIERLKRENEEWHKRRKKERGSK